MSIRPIDMQIAVRGAHEVSSARQGALNKQDNQILNVQQQATAEREHDARAVKSDIRTKEAEIHRKMKGEDQQKQERRKKKDGESHEKKEERRLPGEKGSLLDIRI